MCKWLIRTSLHLIFATIIEILSFFNCESPRYLIKCRKDRQAAENLSRIRNLPEDRGPIARELCEIQAQLEEERSTTVGRGWVSIVREMFATPSIFYRIYIGFAVQILIQWCGAQSITVYAPDFFRLAGSVDRTRNSP